MEGYLEEGFLEQFFEQGYHQGEQPDYLRYV